MRGINYLAGLGTIFIFIGIFCFKALFPKKIYRENMESANYTPVKQSGKVFLIISGFVCIALGFLLILKSFKII
ncbi:MAG: hypothetical protein IPL53_20250 [Ignavibacteria bacterium]|nr:hypothetical protein [Ignavibacteria bacterium]